MRTLFTIILPLHCLTLVACGTPVDPVLHSEELGADCITVGQNPSVLCPLGWFDGNNCLLGTAPAGSHGFVYNGQLYYDAVTPPSCPVPGSWWDGAHCEMPDIPIGTSPFVYLGVNLYYTPVCIKPCSASAVPVYPATATFGVADNFSTVTPDPVLYNPATPPFVSYLVANGVPLSRMTSFDNPNANLHRVATLRHGLRGCFSQTRQLSLCFNARSVTGLSTDDALTLYNGPPQGPYAAFYSAAMSTISGTPWSMGSQGVVCVDLSPQMHSGQITDEIQLRLQDDSDLDYIKLTVY